MDNPTNWNSMCINRDPGIILSKIVLTTEQSKEIIGFPEGAYSYGCLVTFITEKSSTEREFYKDAQIYIPHWTPTNEPAKPIYVRTFRDGNDTKQWKLFMPQSIVDGQVS